MTIFLAILTIGAIIIAIFALGRPSSETHVTSLNKYEEDIRVLNDTIKELKESIAKYKLEIERIDLERENIKKRLDLIIKNNEKVDNMLVNGGWDTNIEFLTDYLSKDDSIGK